MDNVKHLLHMVFFGGGGGGIDYVIYLDMDII